MLLSGRRAVEVSAGLHTFMDGASGEPPARVFRRQMIPREGLLKICFRCAGLTRVAPCGEGELLDGEARAQKRLGNCANAESTRLVVLVPKSKVRRACAVCQLDPPHQDGSNGVRNVMVFS